MERKSNVWDGEYQMMDWLQGKLPFFHELGMEPDEEKIPYYILLDELF